MTRAGLLLVVLAGCATVPSSGYVPGGEGLARDAREAYRRALEQERAQDPAAALEILDELCARHPLRLGFHLARVRVARAAKGPEAAAALYEPAPQGVGADRAGVLAALARLAPEDVAQRKDALHFIAAQEPLEALWPLALAEVELQAYEAAVGRAARERRLGRVQDSAESYAEAEATLERARELSLRALALDPKLAEAQAMLGYLRTRQADEAPGVEARDEFRRMAEDHYLAALEIDPDCLAALLNLAETYLYFDRLDSAGRVLSRAAEIAPRDPLVWNAQGVRNHAVGQLSAAVECYRKSLDLDPANARTRVALADCLSGREDMAAAVRELERARDDAGEDRELLATIAFKLGAIHEDEERYADAIREYERHIELGGEESSKARSRIRTIYEG
jgi:tetratricopeptide (TPR) repeat protein